MTAEEEQQLRELGNDLAGAMQSDWQPACIAAAWRSERAGELALTMQGWIDLDAARSPLLCGGLPQTGVDLDAAFAAFVLGEEGLEPADAVRVVVAMARAVETAFASALRMTPQNPATGDADGFGDWLPMLACLVTQCGLDPAAALGLRVDRAFMLVAAMRRNEGWQVSGEAYALRDVEATPSSLAGARSGEGAASTTEAPDA